MSAKGLFLIGWSQQDILDVINSAKTSIKQGKTIMSYGEGSTNVSKQFALPPDEALIEAQYALQTLWPATYGNPIPQWTKGNYRGMTEY
jgi:hypothetical protein